MNTLQQHYTNEQTGIENTFDLQTVIKKHDSDG
jgi:hypothetical protein